MADEEATEVNPATGSPFSRRYHKLLQRRKNLPVWADRTKFLDALAKNQVVIVAAPPGSGKSTQIPQFVIEAGYARKGKKVVCAQPRRLVASALSRRVAQEMDVKLGEEVGYSVLFEDCSGPKTTLKYLTDGVLLREAMYDRMLQSYRVVILDEVHLRTLATDILLAYFKDLFKSKSRSDLKLVLMSTQDELKKLKDYFKGSRIVQPLPSLHPLEIIHSQDPVRDYVDEAVEIVSQIIVSEPTGDIIVFLTGKEELERCCWKIEKLIMDLGDRIGPVKVIALDSSMPVDMQKKVFKAAPPATKKLSPPIDGVIQHPPSLVGRKVIVSTEIAESSLSIDGIVYSIDCGYTKKKVYNADRHVESLLILPISKASAQRRAGCARRSAGGKCFRLYSKTFLGRNQPQDSPEILRANLAGSILQLRKLGFQDLLKLDLMDPPPAETVLQAVDTLKCLGALDDEGSVTKLGELMSEFPLDPQMAKMLIESPKFCCSNEILSIAAMLSVSNCFLRPIECQEAADKAKATFMHMNGDHLSLLNVYSAYKLNNGNSAWCKSKFISQAVLKAADNVRNQLKLIMDKLNLTQCSPNSNSSNIYNDIGRALLAGYFMQVAKLDDSDSYVTIKGHHVVDLHPTTCLSSRPAFVIYHDFVFASKNFIRIVTDFPQEW
ncbi:probable pre-mRNA-splicing factor ATP-dependent RNA helicase DEAH2 [Zingiber officinale]|uniref:probable pre-mRNA-splicing factor ATP-dependent RNA helicase DEAH2 n=1 Tax=Zingiber officinale TaxID=94328 RepID=UPI001C4CCC85|nr:probable pre-mRNA-splicing factor ATP-dependent RNA helicase DEAH2 [Zingiber officinale]